jgi:hypothetical protein
MVPVVKWASRSCLSDTYWVGAWKGKLGMAFCSICRECLPDTQLKGKGIIHNENAGTNDLPFPEHKVLEKVNILGGLRRSSMSGRQRCVLKYCGTKCEPQPSKF